jgi:predicted metal-dependent peptidase
MQLSELIDYLENLRYQEGDILIYYFDGVQEFEITEAQLLSKGGFGKRVTLS